MNKPLAQAVSALYVVPTFHYDVAYLKTHEGYMPECLRILDEALRLLDLHPDYRFMVEQVILLEAYWARRPEKRDALVRFAREGRLASAPGFYVMPDMNHCDGESLYQQARLGREWLEEHLGLKPDVCWIADCWGHHAQLPQILTQCGYRYYAFWRCMRPDLRRARFIWKGLDGTCLRAHWLARGYGNVLFPTAEELQNAADQDLAGSKAGQIEKVCTDLLAIEPLPNLMLCNGGDFLYPQASAPETVRRLNESKTLPSIRFALPGDYLDTLDWATAPETGGEFNSALQGSFTSHIRIKQRNRQLVRRLLALESMSVVGGEPRSFDAIWKILLKQQFHDIICGTITDNAVRDCLSEFDEAERRIAAAADPDGRATALFNSLDRERTETLDLPGGRARITVPALGIMPVEKAIPLPAPAPAALPLTFENAFFRATIGKDGYLSSLARIGSGEELVRTGHAPFGSLGLQMDYGDLWLNFEAPLSGGSQASIHTQNNPDPYDRTVPGEITYRATMPPRILSATATARGDEEIEIEQQGLLNFWRLNVRFTTRLRLSKHSPRIDYETRIEPSGKHYRIRVAFPSTLKDGRIRHEIPFGIQDRGPHEHVAQHWAACFGPETGLALLNNGTPGTTFADGVLMNTLFRSVAMEYKAPSELGFLEGIPHTFTYALLPVAPGMEPEIVRQGHAFNTPLLPCGAMGRGASHRARADWHLEGDDNVVLSSLRRSGTGVLIRVYECAGRPGTATLSIPSSLSRWAPADGMQRAIGAFAPCDGRLTLTLKPFEIRQIRVEA